MAKAKIETHVIELTKEDFDKLTEELEYRKTIERDEIAAQIAAARELGDLRENHAYSVAMEKKDLNENRITDLESMLKNAKIVTVSSSNVVLIGAVLKITNLKTKKVKEITLVGSEETQAADPVAGKISVDSPLGQALFKAKVGETVKVITPAGEVEYKVESIK